MLRWTLLATVCNSVLQVSIASAPLVGGEGKDELRSHSISNALGVPDHSQNHRCDDGRNLTWQLWKPYQCASCEKNVTFPVTFTNRQYWQNGSWAYCPQHAFTRYADSLSSDEFRAFCPDNITHHAYLRGMYILVNNDGSEVGGHWLPAEFLIACDSATEEKNAAMLSPSHDGIRKLNSRKSSLVHVIQHFQANIVEGSPAPCKDQFNNEQVTPQDVLPACQYGTHVAAVGRSETVHFLWTNNNYADFMKIFSFILPYSKPVNYVNGIATWRPIVDITERKNQCTMKYGYVHEHSGPFDIYYGVECACSKNLWMCNPVQWHPYEGICPRAATIYYHENESALDVESTRDAEVFTKNPFNSSCSAYMLFRTYAGQKFEMQVELGADCPSNRMDAAANGCHQFARDCYGIQPKHVAIACCNVTFCDPAVDQSCSEKPDEAMFASGELMRQINVYLWDPVIPENPVRHSSKFINQVHYCAYHSNLWSEGYSEAPPEYCYVFVDHEWRQFVNISSGWNFDFSDEEHLHFPKGGNNCTIVHGTVRNYCASVSECVEEMSGLGRGVCPPADENDKQRTVVACRCSTQREDPLYYCDENITATEVLKWVERPQCYNGTVPYRESGRYNVSELARVPSEDLNVLCYWYDYEDESGKRWREYGSYNSTEERFADYRLLNCFPADCTPGMTLPHFCCCRTGRNGAASVCNHPDNNLEEEVRVEHERRDAEGTRTNVVERNFCEDQSKLHVNVTGPRELVEKFPEREMCYFKLALRHRKDSEGNTAASEDKATRRFYDSSLHKQFPLTHRLCDRRYWSVADWLDGCACLAVRNGQEWEQNCCCISSTKRSSMDKAVRSERVHRLRTFRDFL